jgi:hypothetical protein
MTSHDGTGFLQRMGSALGDALKRGMAGKSTTEYMKQFSGNDDYWDRAIAAQLGWPGEGPARPDLDRAAGPGARLRESSTAVRRHEPGYEPV